MLCKIAGNEFSCNFYFLRNNRDFFRGVVRNLSVNILTVNSTDYLKKKEYLENNIEIF